MRPWVIQKKTDDVWHVVSSYHPTKESADIAMRELIRQDEAEAYRVYFDPRLTRVKHEA
jgi:hypothetical protein